MTATEKALKLDAWGGPVREGEPCWIIDEIDYTLRRVESAHLIHLNYDVCLLHENRVVKCIAVAKTEADAKRQLEQSARTLLGHSSKRQEAARLFLAGMA